MSAPLPQDAGGGRWVSGCVPCITWAGPPKPSCFKGQSEVNHVGQMGCTGAYQWHPPLKPLWFWLYHILLLMYSVFAFLLILYPYLAVAFQMCSVELGWPPSLHTVHLISQSFLL